MSRTRSRTSRRRSDCWATRRWSTSTRASDAPLSISGPRPRARAAAGIALLALGFLAAPAAPAPAQNLVLQVTAEPPGLDLTATPASATYGVVFYNVQESLVKVDRHGKIVPWLADRWHTSDDRNYTFFLKRGVRFHNGRELR